MTVSRLYVSSLSFLAITCSAYQPTQCCSGLCISELGSMGRTWQIHSDILSSSPLMFTGVSKPEIWPRFLIPIPTDILWFRSEATHWKSI